MPATGAQIAAELGVSTATVSRALRRLGLNRLKALDPPEPMSRWCRSLSNRRLAPGSGPFEDGPEVAMQLCVHLGPFGAVGERDAPGCRTSYAVTYTSAPGMPKNTERMYAMAAHFRSLPSRAIHSAPAIGISRSQGML